MWRIAAGRQTEAEDASIEAEDASTEAEDAATQAEDAANVVSSEGSGNAEEAASVIEEIAKAETSSILSSAMKVAVNDLKNDDKIIKVENSDITENVMQNEICQFNEIKIDADEIDYTQKDDLCGEPTATLRKAWKWC